MLKLIVNIIQISKDDFSFEHVCICEFAVYWRMRYSHIETLLDDG